jgi:hypothetical protein
MKTETLELIAADEAFCAAHSTFERRKDDWIAEGRPAEFPALDRAAIVYSQNIVRLRASYTAAASIGAHGEVAS